LRNRVERREREEIWVDRAKRSGWSARGGWEKKR